MLYGTSREEFTLFKREDKNGNDQPTTQTKRYVPNEKKDIQRYGKLFLLFISIQFICCFMKNVLLFQIFLLQSRFFLYESFLKSFMNVLYDFATIFFFFFLFFLIFHYSCTKISIFVVIFLQQKIFVPYVVFLSFFLSSSNSFFSELKPSS